MPPDQNVEQTTAVVRAEDSPDAPPAPPGPSDPTKAKRVRKVTEEKYSKKTSEELDDEERAAEEEEEEEDEEGDDEKSGDEEDDKKSARAESEEEDEEDAASGAPRRATPPPPQRMRKTATVAEILGLSATASLPAVKTAALHHAACVAKACEITGTKSALAAVGGLQTIADDAAAANTARAELKQIQARDRKRERMSLLTKLATAGIPGYQRGDLFVDREVDGKLVAEPAPLYAKVPLETLRGLVSTKLASAKTAPKRTPFDPDPQAAALGAVPEDTVKRIAARSTSTPERIAQVAAAFAAQQNGAIQ